VARNDELERRLSDHPDDRQSYEVYADWLQLQSDPRGELIMLMLAAEANPSTRLATQISAHDQRHASVFRGPLPFGGNLTWRRGFIDRVLIDRSHINDPVARVLSAVLDHESSRLVSTVDLRDWSPSEDVEASLDALGRSAPRSLRALHLSFANEIPKLAALDKLPNLNAVRIEPSSARREAPPNGGARSIETHGAGQSYGTIREMSWSLGHQAVRDIAHHRWPLTELALDFGHGHGTFDDLRPLFRRDDTSLTNLSIATRSLGRPAFASDLVAALVGSPLAGQLEKLTLELDLSRADYRVLLDHRHRFKRLTEANLPVDRNGKKLVNRSRYG
jgi:uncharacterized protein (TIGR02996 family)